MFKKEHAYKFGLAWIAISMFGTFSLIVYYYGPPYKDENGNNIPDEYDKYSTPIAYLLRAIKSCLDFNRSIQAPISDKLLPDPLQPPYYQPKYTLVIEMSGVLLAPDWTFKSGWRFKKRPTLDIFLQQVSSCYEVVAFTNESSFSLGPILQQLDPEGSKLHYRLFREATRYEKSEHIKDLSCLNRDLSKVILVDCNPKAASLQSRNALILNKWTGDEEDRDLIDVAAFLKMIAMSSVDDVRPVLDYYKQFDNPIEAFREKHEQMLLEQYKRQKESAIKPSPFSKWKIGGS